MEDFTEMKKSVEKQKINFTIKEYNSLIKIDSYSFYLLFTCMNAEYELKKLRINTQNYSEICNNSHRNKKHYGC
jgi:hypothetical protein